MKKLIITTLILLSYQADAQIKAVTDEGKEVVLFDNGTWKFANESDAKVLENITTNETPFTKDKASTFLYRSKKVNAGVYVNPKIWKITDAFKTPVLEYAFVNSLNPNTFGLLVSENIEVGSLKNLKELVVISTQNRADYFKLKESEYRTVNGLKVLYLRYIANTKGLDFEYQTYAFLTDNGYCSLTSYAFAKYFDQNKAELDRFLNGLVEVKKAEGAQTVEVYTSPPPAKIKSKN